MVFLRSKASIENAQENHKFEVAEKNKNGETTTKISEYEQSREERIKENLERMQKLGILDLSHKLKSLNKPTPKSTPSIRTTHGHSTPLPPSGPRRRSSRLQNATPVNYSEVHLTKKDDSLEDEHDLMREEGSKPEFYTEEHEKLLGSTEMSWTLFVDGYGRDGKRIYDPVNGKTCHQCRQKTLGHRTHCSKCNKVQGQFCGDCLYMRYGEHVLEANQNPNWICPVCRGICNCSLCRQAKGWPPTGTLYRKISSLGFKSVAHYIIQTRRKNSDSEATPDSKVPMFAKRSLPFSNAEATSIENESSEFKTRPQGLEYDQSEGQVTGNCIDVGKQEEKPHFLDNEKAECKLNLENCNSMDPGFLGAIRSETDMHDCGIIPLANSTEPLNNKLGLPKTSFKLNGISNAECGTIVKKLDDKRDEGIFHVGKRYVDCFAGPELSPNSKGAKDGSLDVEQQKLSNVISPCTVEATMDHLNPATSDITPVAATEVVISPIANHLCIATVVVAPVSATDSIARRLRPRRGKGNEHGEQRPTGVQQLNDFVSCPLKAEAIVNDTDCIKPAVAPMTRSESNKKRIHISEPSPDSIAGRLRQRRLEGRVV